MHRFAIGLIASAMLFVPGAGWAAGEASGSTAGETYVSDEVTLRLVAEQPDADGTIRAALVVDLAPGWKTYWIDPGEAGIPPRIDLSKSRNLVTDAFAFPAPHRFGDQYGMSNGYSAPLAVALRLHEALPGGATEIRASVTMGVCQQVCIPVSAELSLPPSGVSESSAVADAFAALPVPSDADNGIDTAMLSADGRTLEISGRLVSEENAPAADLFLAGPRGWNFGAPSASTRDGGSVRFTVPVLEKPRKASTEPLTVDAVMTSGTRSVETKGVAIAPTVVPTVVPGG